MRKVSYPLGKRALMKLVKMFDGPEAVIKANIAEDSRKQFKILSKSFHGLFYFRFS